MLNQLSNKSQLATTFPHTNCIYLLISLATNIALVPALDEKVVPFTMIVIPD